MQTRRLLTMSALLAAMTIASGSAVAAPVAKCDCAAQSQDRNFPTEVSSLLKEIRSSAHQLSRDADTLESYSRTRVGWESHAGQLTLAKEHVNAIGKRITRLLEIKHVVAPWQQQTIDSILPIAVNLAARTQAAIEHLNENQNYLWADVYVDHLAAIFHHADQMRELVDLHLELAGTQDKLEQLQKKLGSTRS